MNPNEQAVLVNFDHGSADLEPLHELEDQLIAALEEAGAGEYDGHEVAVDGGDGTLYMYGPDADSLFAVVRPILERSALMRGARVRVRYGPPGAAIREHLVSPPT